MHPQHKAAVEVAQHLHSIEDFQRDIEPAIVSARNEFLTEDTIMGLFGNDYIFEIHPEEPPLYSLHSRSYFFSETDVDRLRDVYDAKLKPLGFTFWEKRTSEMVLMLWTNADYSASVDVVAHPGIRTGTHYGASKLRSDGSTDKPTKLLPLEGREPDWLTPELTEKYRQR